MKKGSVRHKYPLKGIHRSSGNLVLGCNYYLQIVGEMYAGESFGELSLLHGTKRAATIICKGNAEFLRVDKSDFDGVSWIYSCSFPVLPLILVCVIPK